MRRETEAASASVGPNSSSSPSPELSIVIPVFNEEGSLSALYGELTDSLEKYGRSYEILFVDDGSTDASFAILSSLHHRDGRVRVIRFRRNFGQTAALAAGFDHARGAVIVTLDGDRQNDPADIPSLIGRLENGFDIVCGWRKERQDPFFSRRLPSQIANRLISLTTGVHLHDYGCTLRAMRAEVAKNVQLYGEMHRFIPAVASWMGVDIEEVVVSHRPRQEGKSKYGLARTLRVLLDLLTVKFLLNYSSRPLQIFGSVGLLLGASGFVMGCYLTWVKYALSQPIAGRPLLFLAILLMFSGLQLVSLGLLGELLARLYHETRSRPAYAIREVLSSTDRQDG
jgi:glycosyltransferase involved in cell wall biosynthesis